MKVKKILCTVLAVVTVLGCSGITAWAVEVEPEDTESSVVFMDIARATGRINVNIPANTKARVGTAFPLEAGAVVTINASYSPRTASVDFGLISPNGSFHYINVKNGSINRGIQVAQRGNYTLQIRNNSASAVQVTGFVSY